ncbi:ParA family protein [Pokkaliibacter sp. MBI-7]|uniref:ParA family protein n=1 Tax=Pokkaliibacter sp. MBI-7 TaxID=3040600 RepID=UPI002449E196|nr:ParA family protein [Pokkaliibacter sp. MBI-7]MDH2436617.1 ParA family protein [Pokkaliibacter sp. MBI-7]
MKKIIAVTNSKGGVGKSTTVVNLAALLADAGLRTLIVDLDIQPTASSYFHLTSEAPFGISELLSQNLSPSDQIISRTSIDGLDLVKSNDPSGSLGTSLLHAPDGRIRLRRLLTRFDYDIILLDTQGARSVVLDMAMLAADLVVSPVTTATLSAREFIRGMGQLYSELTPMAEAMGITIPTMQILLNQIDNTNNSTMVTELIKSMATEECWFTVLQTEVPDLVAYKNASALGVAAHRYEPKRPAGRQAPSCLESMVDLALELLPEHEATITAYCKTLK